DGMWHRWFLDPIFHGTYPEEVAQALEMPPALVRMGELETINNPVDFLGLNYYSRVRVRAGEDGAMDPRVVPPSGALTTMGNEVYPQGLTTVLKRLHEDYQPQRIYISENGAAYPDRVDERGEVHDPERLRYLREHLLAARTAIAEGVPLEGYFVWSL